jgi:nicotinamidase-related amidase
MMTASTAPDFYDPRRTALLLVDPLNDFLGDKGQLTQVLKPVGDKVGLLPNLHLALNSARAAHLKIFYGCHRRYEDGYHSGWRFLNSSQAGTEKNQMFARGQYGGDYHPDLKPEPGETVVAEHWTASAFANTDLDMQLKNQGVDHIVLAGLVANTCLESTGRYGVELGYHVTFLKDATSAFSEEAYHAAVDINWPAFAHAILTTKQFVEKLKTN